MSALRDLVILALQLTLCKDCNKCWIQLICMLLYLEELEICYVTMTRFLICEF